MEKAKKTSRSDKLLQKTAEMCFSKTCVNFGRCYGNQEWTESVEKYFLVFQSSSFKLSGSFKFIDQGVLEIFKEVYLGGGGGTMLPPSPVGIGLRERS